jgi:Plasmid replication region DNA-binding N-term.
MELSEVADACDALGKNGAKVTVRSVQQYLGRGNQGEIARHLREIRGQVTGQAEILRLRRRVAELEAERARLDAALAACGAWAAEIYRQHVQAYPTLHAPLPPQEPRLVEAKRT